MRDEGAAVLEREIPKHSLALSRVWGVGGGKEKREEQEGGSAGPGHRTGTTRPTAVLSLPRSPGSLVTGQVLITSERFTGALPLCGGSVCTS